MYSPSVCPVFSIIPVAIISSSFFVNNLYLGFIKAVLLWDGSLLWTIGKFNGHPSYRIYYKFVRSDSFPGRFKLFQLACSILSIYCTFMSKIMGKAHLIVSVVVDGSYCCGSDFSFLLCLWTGFLPCPWPLNKKGLWL